MLENITNKVVINLNENNSSIPPFPQKESSEQNSDNIRTFTKEERTLSDPEDKGIERNSFKERADVPAAGHGMISYPNCGQAFHPNFDTVGMFCINQVVIAYCCGGIDCIKRTIQVL
jgi:hypothetical protein